MSISATRLKLKVIYQTATLGFSIDQTFLQTSYPLTRYYFWPKTNAWDQIQMELDSKLWLENGDKIKMLNLVTEIMNAWRQKTSLQEIDLVDVEIVDLLELG